MHNCYYSRLYGQRTTVKPLAPMFPIGVVANTMTEDSASPRREILLHLY